MSKRLNKILMAVLAAVVALCMVIATAGLTTARADVTTGNITMLNSAQVRQTGEMGIRFSATISATDYEALSAQGAEFGMIIAPADWVESDDDLAFGSSKLSLYDGTQGANDKFFAKGTNTPVQDINNFDGDDDTSEYILTCSFIKIKESNFDRNFKARAYYKIGNDYFHSDNVIDRNIYTVASNALVNGDVEDEVVTDYLAGIVGKVADEDSTLNVTVNGDVANKGDKFTVTAKLTTAKNKVVDTAVALSVEKDGEPVVDGLTYDETTGEYTVNTAGKLTLVANAGAKTVVVKELSIKRDDVTLNLIPGRRAIVDGQGTVFTAFADSDNVKLSDFGYNVHDVVGDSIILNFEVEDELATTDPKITVDIKSDNAWLTEVRDGPIFLKMNRAVGIPVTDTIVTGTYTDADGMTYSDSFTISGHTLAEGYAETAYSNYSYTNGDATVSFNQVSTYISNETSVLIKNVPLTSSHDADIIRLTYPNWNEAEKTHIRRMSIRFVDVNDPNNWVEALVGQHSSAPSNQILGMNTNSWESTLAGLGATALYNYRDTEIVFHNDFSLDSGKHAMDDTRFHWNNTYDVYGERYYFHMGGFSIVNDEISFNTIRSGARFNRLICSKTAQETMIPATSGIENLNIWEGFTSKGVTNVNIIISIGRMITPEGGTYQEQRLLIDTLGGRAVTAADASKFVYISKVS